MHIDINLQIEKIVKEKKISYIEGVLELVENKDFDMIELSKCLNRSIKEKIQYEGESRNLLKTTGTRLNFED